MQVYFMRLKSVMERVGLSRSMIYLLVQQGEFPAPVKLGKRASAWSSKDIDKWIADKIRKGVR